MPLHSQYKSDLRQAAEYILQKIQKQPEVAIVLGTGLSGFADKAFQGERGEISYADIPSLPKTTVAGHRGKLYYGIIAGRMSICFAGRFHSYEMHPPHILTLLPRLAHQLGCKLYILTNAAGGTSPQMNVGCLMSITEHSSVFRFNLLNGFEAINSNDVKLTENNLLNDVKKINYPFSIKSQDIYSKQIIETAQKIASEENFVQDTKFMINGQERIVRLFQGNYVSYSGPYYETGLEAQKCTFHAPGSVGMSSIPEALAAKMCGMNVYGMSLVTDMCCIGENGENLSHETVQEVAGKVSNAVETLFSRILQRTDIEKLDKQVPWGEPANDFEMTPANTGFCTENDVKHKIQELSVQNQLTKAIFYPNPSFSIYTDGQTLFIAAPKYIGCFEISLAIQLIIHYKIADVRYVVPQLEANSVYNSANIINITSQFLLYNIQSQNRLYKVPGAKLMLFDQIEDPRSSQYCTSLGKVLNAEVSNAASALPALIGQQIGLNIVYCGVSALNKEVEQLNTINFDQKPVFTSVKSVFSFYEGEQFTSLSPNYIKDIAELKKLKFKRVFVSDSTKFIKSGEAINTSFNAAFNSQTGTLYIQLPQLCDNKTIFECSYPIRCLNEFKKDIQIVIVTDNSDVQKPTIINELINITGINPLRGENCDDFGPRFNPMLHIKDSSIAEQFIKHGYEESPFYMSLDVKTKCNAVEKMLFNGAMMCIFCICHQEMRAVGICVRDEAQMSEVEKLWVQ